MYRSSSSKTAMRTATALPRVAASLLVLTIAVLISQVSTAAQVSQTGQWQTLPYTMPINPIHVALMHNGKVLIVSGSGNYPQDTDYESAVWDPTAGSITTQPLTWDMFCNGMIGLADGRIFVMGGNLQYDPFYGEAKTSVYDPATGQFTDMQPMAHGRWYPTPTVLADGSVMVFSGLSETGSTNSAVEIYKVGSGWSQQYIAPWVPPLYPRMHLLPNGTVFNSAPNPVSNIFDPSTQTWQMNVAATNYGGDRTYGSSVLLPLTPANNYRPRVFILGGGNPATNTTEVIDLSASNPQWVWGPPMTQPRIEMNATLLPNGTILAVGGSVNDEDLGSVSFTADLFNVNSDTITQSSAGSNAFARLYHSVELLLPDATLLVAGGNPARGTYEPHMEIYSPPYLFNADGTPATRPTITSVTPGVVGYGTTFQVSSPDAASISSVVLMRLGSVTHAFDMDQRMVGLNFTVQGTTLTLTSPPNGNIAPPGYYLLFILNSSGVPSVAQFVQISTDPANTPPTGMITSPSSDITVGVNDPVSFAGTGSDRSGTITAYSWVFSGGTPSVSNSAVPGIVTFSSMGTFRASLTVTDSFGLTDPSPETRTITVVPSFFLSASPSSQSVIAGGSAAYDVVTTPNIGFAGAISLSASGLPAGVTAAFNPPSLTSGSATMTLNAGPTAVSGTYIVTITGTSGALNETATVTLVVSPISIQPTTVTLIANQIQPFTVTNAGNQAITWAINPTVGSISSAGVYLVPASISTTQQITVTATEPDGVTTAIAHITLASAAVSFVGSDAGTQGSWIGSYGADGYSVPNGVQNLPSYASFSVSGQSNYTWAASTTDVRALQTPAGSGRMASVWYSAPSFTFDLNLRDGNTHQIALYALDWDNYQGGRAEQIQILDASSGVVLDTENLTGFQNGQYLVWNVYGHVKIVVTTTNSNSNAALSGIFFESSVIGVNVTPQSPSLSPGQIQQFSAAVVGTPSKAVTWSISNASNPGNPAPGSISSSGLYTAPATVVSPVNLMVTATASDNVTLGTSTLSLSAGTAPSGPTATYLGTDATTQGGWIGTYGGDGYAIPNGAQSLPSYASFSVSGQSSYTWAASTADVRALQTPGGVGRMASLWYSAPSFTMDVNLKDGNTHQIALYALDWDNYQGGRAEQIQILDANTNNALDTRNATSFQNGQYLVWNINGHVKIVITTTKGNSNAALSGIFFESSLIGVTVTPQSPSLSPGQNQQFAAAVVGTPNKAVTWSVSNTSNPGNPAPGSISSGGLYTAPASVAGAVNLIVTATASDNVTVGTATLSLEAGTAPSGPSATYLGIDTTTQGNWIGAYGGDGYAIPNGAQSLPSYASFSVSGQSSYTWAGSTGDARALQTPSGASRMASLWFNASSFTMDVNLKDENTHQVALYALDWDGYQGGRAEQIQILDASTNNVLDTRNVTGFQNGQYLVWNINGHVKIVVTTTNPNSNAAISGVFFESSLIGVSVTPQGASLTGGQTQQYSAQVTGTPNKTLTWTISNASNPGNPAPGSISSSGLYTAPASVASATNLTVTATASDNATVGTAPLSLTAGTASSRATATYMGTDATTQGNWIGTYGGNGYVIPNGAQSSPSYATFAVSGQSSYTWAASTADVRALQNPGGSGRMASVWYNAPSFTLDVNMNDGNTHQLALYALDWDNYEGGRAEQIQILDASTNNLLDTRNVTSFENGQYLVWNINGHVKIILTTTNPNSNAVISGVFF